MKKKIFSICVVVLVLALAISGASLAYLTDNEAAKNTFTIGNVDIRLDETFTQGSKLMPGIDVEKVVNVTNVGTEAAYVRVHIAIPAILDSGSEDQPQFAAYNNTLHWNFSRDSVADGLWNWNKDNVNGDSLAGYPGNGGEWNFYTTEIDGIAYNVYVATYETALAANETTKLPAIYKVFLDAKLNNADINEINEGLNGKWNIYVAAEAVQQVGFDNAYDAFKAAVENGNLSVDWAKAVAADNAQVDED